MSDLSGSTNDTLNLDALKIGMQGVTSRIAAVYEEAAVTCLEEAGHASGVDMEIDGDNTHLMKVIWTKEGDAGQRSRAWGDKNVAVEHGAYGIAALLIDSLTEYTVVERSQKGTGIDYWLGKKGADETLFQAKARLDVSGIRKGDDRDIGARVRHKEKQITPSDGRLPGIIVVVEFSSPRARMRTKNA